MLLVLAFDFSNVLLPNHFEGSVLIEKSFSMLSFASLGHEFDGVEKRPCWMDFMLLRRFMNRPTRGRSSLSSLFSSLSEEKVSFGSRRRTSVGSVVDVCAFLVACFWFAFNAVSIFFSISLVSVSMRVRTLLTAPSFRR